MHPKTRTVITVVIACGLILGGLLYWETTGNPSPLCGGCYRYNAPGCVVTPCPGQEALSVEASQVNSPTNLTLTIRNSGAASVGLDSYSVKDSVGNQYTKSNWAGPTLAVNSVGIINIVIDGSAFTFQSKSYYTVIVTTARNNLFTFAITA